MADLCYGFRYQCSPAQAGQKSVEVTCPHCGRELLAMTKKPRGEWPFAIAPRHRRPEDVPAKKKRKQC